MEQEIKNEELQNEEAKEEETVKAEEASEEKESTGGEKPVHGLCREKRHHHRQALY